MPWRRIMRWAGGLNMPDEDRQPVTGSVPGTGVGTGAGLG